MEKIADLVCWWCLFSTLTTGFWALEEFCEMADRTKHLEEALVRDECEECEKRGEEGKNITTCVQQ